MKTLFVPVYIKENFEPLLEKSLKALKGVSKVSILTTIQHINSLDEIKDFYNKHNIKVEFLNSIKDNTAQGIIAKHKSQIIGCDATSVRKSSGDIIIYLGSGKFHPIAIFLNSNKEILQINPEEKTIGFFDDKEIRKFLAKKAARIQKLNDSKKIGIWISTKPGQYNEKLAIKVKKFLEGQQKQVYLFISDILSANEMINFRDIEVWVNTACPRIIEDQELFSKTVVNAEDILKSQAL